MELALIAAIGANGVIGADGEVPWDLPADLAHFKATTVGHPVIVGRRTFESIVESVGGPLPERTTIVLTRSPDLLPESVEAVETPEAALTAAEATGARTAYVIGGADVYETFLPRADELVLTELADAYDGDTWFPDVDWDRWTAVERDQHTSFDIVRYRRVEST